MKSSIVPLGEVVDFKGGGTPSRGTPDYWGGQIPWATVKDFNNGFSITSTQEYITEKGLKNSASNLIPAGTVIIPTRMALGKVAISKVDVAINQDLKAVFPKKEIDTSYLAWFFACSSKKIEGMGKGATVKGITLDALRTLEFPLPPLPEQRRIAAILDKADELRQKRRQTIEKLDQLLQSVFLDMFGDPVTNPKRWQVKSVKQCIETGIVASIQDGNHGNDHPKVKDFSSKGIPFITANVVKNGEILFNKCYYLDHSWLEKLRIGFAKPNDVLISHKGTLGLTAILDDTFPIYIFSPQTTYYRVNSEGIIPEYLKGYFDTPFFQKLFAKEGIQSTRAYLGITRQKQLPIMLPPIEAQKAFRDVVKVIRRQRNLLVASESKSNDMFPSLQQRAFNGTL